MGPVLMRQKRYYEGERQQRNHDGERQQEEQRNYNGEQRIYEGKRQQRNYEDDDQHEDKQQRQEFSDAESVYSVGSSGDGDVVVIENVHETTSRGKRRCDAEQTEAKRMKRGEDSDALESTVRRIVDCVDLEKKPSRVAAIRQIVTEAMEANQEREFQRAQERKAERKRLAAELAAVKKLRQELEPLVAGRCADVMEGLQKGYAALAEDLANFIESQTPASRPQPTTPRPSSGRPSSSAEAPRPRPSPRSEAPRPSSSSSSSSSSSPRSPGAPRPSPSPRSPGAPRPSPSSSPGAATAAHTPTVHENPNYTSPTFQEQLADAQAQEREHVAV
jgi:hypothetical protein